MGKDPIIEGISVKIFLRLDEISALPGKYKDAHSSELGALAQKNL